VPSLKHQFKEPKDGYHPYNMAKVVTRRVAERAAAEAKRVLLKKDDKNRSLPTPHLEWNVSSKCYMTCLQMTSIILGRGGKRKKIKERIYIMIHTYIDIRTHMYGHILIHASMEQSHIETDTAVKRHGVRIQ